ncbi:MAG: hypothetical protein NVSMB58_28850 [Terriglobales bacterium]
METTRPAGSHDFADEFLVSPRKAEDPRILSIGQQRLWYLSQLSPNNSAYNVPYASRIRGHLDIPALQKALDAVVKRHEVLRTVVLAPGGNPVPVLLKKWTVELKQLDLRHVPDELRETEAQRVLSEESSRPFNLAKDLMLRTVLVRVGEEEFIFLHIAPHMAFEGGSVGIFFRDLARFYDAYRKGAEPDVAGLRVQYCDYALWQLKRLQGEKLDDLARYWKKQLEGAPLVNLPLDNPRPGILTMRGRRHFWKMPSDLLLSARQFFRDSDTTPYRGLMATFNVFLKAYSGVTDISLGSPFGPRCRGIEDVIGFFVNTVVIRTDLTGDPSFRELMKRVDGVVRGAIEHSDLTFDKIVEAVQPARDSSRTPLFQVNFRAPKEPYPTLQLQGVNADRAQYIDNGTAKFDLALEIESSAGEACYFEYCTDLFTDRTVAKMVDDFQRILRGLMAEADVPLSKTNVLREIGARTGRRAG